jgi:hypothetical protein
MSNTLIVNTALVNDHWEITATLSPGTIPAEVFIHLNTATNIKGDYVGICNLDELSRLQVYTGTPIPIFGNKYLRSDSVKIIVPIEADTSAIINTIVASVTTLSKAYQAEVNSTQVFTIS